MWEGLSAFEHVQCTLLARGLPLVKSSLPCSLSPLSLPRLAVPCVLFFFFHFAFAFFEVIVRADATEMLSSCPQGRYYCLAHCPYGRAVLHWYRACVCKYRPCVREYRTVFLWFRRICLCCSRGASWPAPGRSVRAAGRAYATIVGRLCPLSRWRPGFDPGRTPDPSEPIYAREPPTTCAIHCGWSSVW